MRLSGQARPGTGLQAPAGAGPMLHRARPYGSATCLYSMRANGGAPSLQEPCGTGSSPCGQYSWYPPRSNLRYKQYLPDVTVPLYRPMCASGTGTPRLLPYMIRMFLPDWNTHVQPLLPVRLAPVSPMPARFDPFTRPAIERSVVFMEPHMRAMQLAIVESDMLMPAVSRTVFLIWPTGTFVARAAAIIVTTLLP